jgi:hypothetical protein
MTGRPGWKPVGPAPAPIPIPLPAVPRRARDDTPRRQGIPEGHHYTYRGTDLARDADIEQQLVSIRRRAARRREQALHLTPAQLLDICEAIDGPDWEWYREAGDQP